ncbi:interleukin-25 [Erythrolamprus reginae]|uniref:interleukin-25 n=1 Tax=Erythrolamprus reginae TaxID=121349 RepID=UPI00396CDFDC
MQHLWLAVLSVLFSAPLLRQAHGCFSKHDCCHHSRIDQLGAGLRVPEPIPTPPSPTDSATGCRATSSGTEAQRSTSPWSYKKDFIPTRYPQNLWQASCSCDHCLSLKPSVPHQKMKTYNSLDPRGNSVTVTSSILVFYRVQCPDHLGLYYLQPQNYVVNVSCACVVPIYSSKGQEIVKIHAQVILNVWMKATQQENSSNQ